MTITVYTKPNCQPCRATKRFLTENDIAFEEADATDPANVAAARSLGYQEAPVVVVAPDGVGSETSWSGFRPDLLRELVDSRLS